MPDALVSSKEHREILYQPIAGDIIQASVAVPFRHIRAELPHEAGCAIE
jgi:hypothetical protein